MSVPIESSLGVGSAENSINDRLAQTPDVYLLGLAQIAISAETDVVSTITVHYGFDG